MTPLGHGSERADGVTDKNMKIYSQPSRQRPIIGILIFLALEMS